MGLQTRSYRVLLSVCLLVVVVALPVLSAPKSGGSVRMSLADSDVTSFDPIVPFDNMSIWTMLHMYDQLVRAGKDGATIEPGVADSWKTSADGKTWVLHIRDGVTFADGTPLTADDARAALERAGSKDSNFEDNFALIDHATATDPHTLVVILKKPSASFLAYASLYAASIVPAKASAIFLYPATTGWSPSAEPPSLSLFDGSEAASAVSLNGIPSLELSASIQAFSFLLTPASLAPMVLYGSTVQETGTIPAPEAMEYIFERFRAG